jgi:hypothetical protein
MSKAELNRAQHLKNIQSKAKIEIEKQQEVHNNSLQKYLRPNLALLVKRKLLNLV